MNQRPPPRGALDDWLFEMILFDRPVYARELSEKRGMTAWSANYAMVNLARSGFVERHGLTIQWELTDAGKERVSKLIRM
jgi:predicted transcriptional regulator